MATYPNLTSSEVDALITDIGGIKLESEHPSLLDSEQWVALPERTGGFVCAKQAPIASVEKLTTILSCVHDVNTVLNA